MASHQGWIDTWEQGFIPFHETERNKFLGKHLDKMVAGRGNIKIFVPLCGKAVDMKDLYDAGHTVVGIDLSDVAMKAFFKESNIAYTTEPATNFPGTLYKSHDGRIRLYVGDLFEFNANVEGTFDGIWDRGSLGAMNKEDIPKYCKLLVSLMNKTTQYLLETFEYDLSVMSGPPNSFTLALARETYGEGCKVELLDSADGMRDFFAEMGHKYMRENFFHVTSAS